MQRVFVMDAEKQPLMPCPPARARRLLRNGRAAIWRHYPYAIILTAHHFARAREPDVQPLRLKIDPGAKTTGLALVDETAKTVVWAMELTHRGDAISKKLLARRSARRNRRTRKVRHRKARFENRTRPKGWLAPSLRHRLEGILAWVERLRRFAPISALSMELVRFDTQLMENAEISGIEYQQGTLQGYEIREYLLEKHGRKCVYCGAEDVPLEIEHIVPRSRRGGSDRISNLTLSCVPCNRKKGNRTADEFGHPEVQAGSKKPLRDAAAVNATRWALWNALKESGLPLERGTGGRTKFNRSQQAYPKAHWIDAACVGESGADLAIPKDLAPLAVRSVGHGSRQMCATDKQGFPKQHKTRRKRHHGFQSGDIVKAHKPKGKDAGVHRGRLAVRASGSFDLVKAEPGRPVCVNAKHCVALHRCDGYAYGPGLSLEDLRKSATENCRQLRTANSNP